MTFSIVFANSNLLVLTTVVELGGVGDVPRVTTFTDTKHSGSSVCFSISTSGLGELFLLSRAVNRERVLIEDFPLKSLEDKYDMDLSGMVVLCRDDPVERYLGV